MAEGYSFVIGCDEVGRGSFAGPVVAAAVAWPQVKSGKLQVRSLRQIRDSKLLAPKKREELSRFIKENFLWGVAEVAPETIDRINIHNATLLAMRSAVENLLQSAGSVLPEFLSASEKISGIQEERPMGTTQKHGSLSCGWDDTVRTFLYLDGKFIIPSFNMKQEAVVDGDNKILSVAAASIVAKVYRDELMASMDAQYPDYGFARHKGYGTLHHRQMILAHGLSQIHRRTFCH